jgi:hypothetical protein
VQSSETPAQHQSKAKDHFRSLWRFGRVVLVALILLVLEHSTFHRVLGLHEWEMSFVGLFYQPLLKAGFPKWTPLFTTLLRVDSPDLQTGPQRIRRTPEQILPRVLESGPAAIVLDCTLQKGLSAGIRRNSQLAQTSGFALGGPGGGRLRIAF